MTASKSALDIEIKLAQDHVQMVARWFRERGLKSGHAIQRAADCLCISHDLAWRFCYRAEIGRRAIASLRLMERNFLAAVRQEIAYQDARLARLHQIEAEVAAKLEAIECSSDGFVSFSPSVLSET